MQVQRMDNMVYRTSSFPVEQLEHEPENRNNEKDHQWYLFKEIGTETSLRLHADLDQLTDCVSARPR